eukprot:1802258-Prymnesium_polylepis.1
MRQRLRSSPRAPHHHAPSLSAFSPRTPQVLGVREPAAGGRSQLANDGAVRRRRFDDRLGRGRQGARAGRAGGVCVRRGRATRRQDPSH